MKKTMKINFVRLYVKLFILAFLSILTGCHKPVDKPNILFVMMDDLGYGQFGIYNDTLTTGDFDPFFVHLVDSLQGYSLDSALLYSKKALPTISKLAKEGFLFTNTYTSSNICAPSRLSIATSKMQAKFGIYTNVDCENSGILPGTHMAENLKKIGYKNAHVGKWHIGKRDQQIINNVLLKHGIPDKEESSQQRRMSPEIAREIDEAGYEGSVVMEQNPLNNGFDYYFGYNHWASQYYNSNLVWENFEHAGKQQGYNTDVFTDKAIGFMDEQIQNGNPFYVQLHYHAVHDSIEPKAPERFYNRFKSDNYLLNNFYAHVYGVDCNVNRIVEFLKSKGQYENTIIVFTSDNGAMSAGPYDGHKSGSPLPGNAPFSGHKGTFFQGGFRVPMFILWPDGIKNSYIADQLVSTMDILPTLIDAAGGKIPEGIDGKSLLPLLSGQENYQPHDHLIWAGIHSFKWGFLIKKTTKNHSNESGFAPPAWEIVQGGYLLRFIGSLPVGVYLDHLDGRAGGIIELFNIKNDPAELHNLSAQMPEKVKEMAQIYFNESIEFKPPAVWPKKKWDELVNSKDLINDLP